MTARETARLERLRALAREADKATGARDRAIVRALAAGHSLRSIADVTGLDRTTLWRRFQ